MVKLTVDLGIESVEVAHSYTKPTCPVCKTPIISLVLADASLHSYKIVLTTVKFSKECVEGKAFAPLLHNDRPVFRCMANHYFVFYDLHKVTLQEVESEEFNQIDPEIPLDEQIVPRTLSVGEGI